jgi:hypothetical protein
MEEPFEPTYYIDTNIFLNAILYDPDVNTDAKAAKKLLGKIIAGNVKAITSLLTWDEFTWIVQKNLGRQVAIEKGQAFLNHPNLAFKKVSIDIVQRAQDLLSVYTIRPRDALHAATAILNRTTTIISCDGDLDEIKEIVRLDPALLQEQGG